MLASEAALAAGQGAERLVQDFYSLIAALAVATNPRAPQLAPMVLPGHAVPVAMVSRKDGTAHAYHFVHFLMRVATEPRLPRDFEKTWMAGALIALGDTLAVQRYFDHAPELELVYHLRNGVAHGNRFSLKEQGIRRLQRYPANNHLASTRGDLKTNFEITPALSNAAVLFDFMGPGDVLDLIMSVATYLIRMGNGEPLRPALS